MSTAAATRGVDTPSTLAQFDFDLPPELIAQEPAARRDLARLMVVDRKSGACTHAAVQALPQHLVAGDLLVVNDTRVIPARLRGRSATGGRIELLALHAGVA